MSNFEMPQVERGEWVLFKPGPNSAGWTPFFVTEVFDNNISGIAVDGMSLRTGPSSVRMNVKHADDPRLADPLFVQRMIEEEDQGIFVLHPTRLRMEARISRLEESFFRGNGKPKGRHSQELEPEAA
jgi:hypothetical protein